MKKTSIIVASIFVFLLIVAFVLPSFLKGKIIEKVDQALEENVNADVYYNPQKVSASIFRRFPNVSVSIGDFGIVGREVFAQDTLIHVDRVQVDFNLRSLLFGDYPTLTGVHLDGADILVKVLEDGSANYDITFPSEDASTESDLQIGIDLIEVNDVNLVYDDRSLNFLMALGNLAAVGSGDFTLDVYEMPLKASADILTMNYEGVSYLSNKKFKGETLLGIDLNEMKFTLGDGSFALNDFLFDLKGLIALPEESIDFDLVFFSKESSFKTLLSLVPGMYTESFEGLKASGTVDFRGMFKGSYSEESFPSFDIGLNVMDGMFQYPDLPLPVSDVQLEMHLKNATSDLSNTTINIPIFNLRMGNNPIESRFFIANLRSYDMDASVRGKLNLQELTSIFPVDGMQVRGLLDVKAIAKGRYDEAKKELPNLDIQLAFQDGFVKNSDIPTALEQINVQASILNPSGKMNDFRVNLEPFSFLLENEKVEGKMRISDFEQLNWDGAIKGALDIGKMMAIFPQEGMELAGKIQADITTKGSYDAVKKEQYNRLDTRGFANLSDFSFSSTDIPQGVLITSAKAEFNPDRITLTEFASQLGQSPLFATGSLSNYMNYLFEKDATLRGQLNLQSDKFNVNEWMTDSSTSDEALEVIALPTNIDFNMNVLAKEVLYDNLNLRDVRGNMTLRNGVLSFKDTGMRLLGGQVTMNGSYDPTDLTKPTFDFGLAINSLSIPESFKAFNTVQILAPIAQHLTGVVNSTLNFSGTLGADMMPILSSLDGKGILRVAEASYQNSAIVQGVTSLTRLNETNTLVFRNVAIPIQISQGVLNVQPFDVRLWDYQANIQGSTGFDGSINYLINMQVPAGKFGSTANNLLATISGTQATSNTIIPLAINLGGSYGSPRFSLAGGNSIENLLTSALQSRVQTERQNITEQATQQFRAAEDSIRRELQVRSEQLQDSARREAEKKVNEVKGKATDEATKVIRNLIRPRNTKPDTTGKN
ncbi:MAG: AsmA-like C-terminal region-containing protein [Mongoliitalea sp.]